MVFSIKNAHMEIVILLIHLVVKWLRALGIDDVNVQWVRMCCVSPRAGTFLGEVVYVCVCAPVRAPTYPLTF